MEKEFPTSPVPKLARRYLHRASGGFFALTGTSSPKRRGDKFV